MNAIEKHAAELAQQYTERLLTDDALAARVLDNVPGNMVTAQCVEIGRAVMRGDREAVFQLMTAFVGAAIKDQAEMDAESSAEFWDAIRDEVNRDYAEDQKRMARIEAMH